MRTLQATGEFTLTFQARHIMRIHHFAVAHRVSTRGAFNLKAKLLIQAERFVVIGEHRQLNARHLQLVVAQINHR